MTHAGQRSRDYRDVRPTRTKTALLCDALRVWQTWCHGPARRPRHTTLSADPLRALAAHLAVQLADKEHEVGEKERELRDRQTRIDQLTHELSVIKRQQFGKRSKQLNTEQMSLLDEASDTDLAAIEAELEQLQPDTPERKSRQQRLRRAPLPAHLPRTDIHHDPDATTCQCGCELERVREDISEKLDYMPGVFTVERHIRGKWVCRQCETLTQEPVPVPAHVIDKGIPTAALLALVLVSKFADHLPL